MVCRRVRRASVQSDFSKHFPDFFKNMSRKNASPMYGVRSSRQKSQKKSLQPILSASFCHCHVPKRLFGSLLMLFDRQMRPNRGQVRVLHVQIRLNRGLVRWICDQIVRLWVTIQRDTHIPPFVQVPAPGNATATARSSSPLKSLPYYLLPAPTSSAPA